MSASGSVPSWPTPQGGLGLSDLKILGRVLGMALRHRRSMAIAVATTIVAAVLQLLIPRYLGQAVDTAQGLLGGGDPAAARGALWQAAALLLGLLLLYLAFSLPFAGTLLWCLATLLGLGALLLALWRRGEIEGAPAPAPASV